MNKLQSIRPQFVEGVHWRRLSKEERHGSKWKYVLLRDVFISCATGVESTYELRDGKDIQWGAITPSGILVCEDYAWDGCSKSPDWLLLNSLPHDLLFQFSGCEGFPLPLGYADLLFLEIGPLWLSSLYYAGLRAGSWSHWRRPPTNGDHVVYVHHPESCHELQTTT